MKSLNTELARLMGFFAAPAGLSLPVPTQAGGLSSPTAVIAQPPSPRGGGGGSSFCACGDPLAECTCVEAV